MRYLLQLFTLFSVTVDSAAQTEHKTTIIGAGLAGLTAAYRLRQRGVSCEIHEACKRSGGRVFTAYFKNGYEELGGKNVYGKDILSLIEELGLQMESYTSRLPRFISLDGKMHMHETLFENAPEPDNTAFFTLQKRVPTVKNLGELIDPFFAGNPLIRRVMEIAMRGWEGSSTYALSPEHLELSFWQIYKAYYSFKHEMSLDKESKECIQWVKGGNSRLIEALVKRVEGDIHYQHPLRKITRGSKGKVLLHFDDSCVSTDYLILAIPCTTLCDIEIEEGIFPEDQQRAVRTLQYGTNAKMLLPVALGEEVRTDVILTENRICFFNRDFTVMTLYCGGEPGIFNAYATKSLSDIFYREIPHVRAIYPHMRFPSGLTATAVSDQLFTNYDQPIGISWAQEEFSKGSYSNYAPGTFTFFNEFIEDHGESVRKVFRSIEGRIFFAGEHTAPSGDNGTMGGAVHSGERAMRMVLRAQGGAS